MMKRSVNQRRFAPLWAVATALAASMIAFGCVGSGDLSGLLDGLNLDLSGLLGGSGNDNAADNGNGNVGDDNGNGNVDDNGNDNGADDNANDNVDDNANDNVDDNGNDNADDNGNDNGGDDSAGRVELNAELGADGAPQASVEWRADRERLRFHLEAEGLAAGEYDVFINDVLVTTIVIDADGRGRLRFDTAPNSGDQPFPTGFPTELLDGDMVRIGDALSGALVAEDNSGADDNGNDNGGDDNANDNGGDDNSNDNGGDDNGNDNGDDNDNN